MLRLFADPLPLALVVAGVLVAFVNARVTFRRALNTKLYLAAVRKAAKAGNHDRIRKILRAASPAELVELTARWLDLDLPEVVHAPSSSGYREASEVVPYEERAREALRPYVDTRRRRLAMLFPSSLLAAGLAAAGVALSAERELLLAFAGVAGLLSLYGGRGVWRMRRDLVTALDELVTYPGPDREDG